MPNRLAPGYLLPSFGLGLRERLSADLEAHWAAVATNLKPARGDTDILSWGYQVTPAFPKRWNPPDGVLIYYAFSYGFAPSLFDGAPVVAPWASVLVPAANPEESRVEPINAPVRKLGIQGITPLSSDEQAIYALADFVDSRLALMVQPTHETARSSDDSRSVGAFYRLWLHHNAVIADELRPHHAAFIDWIDSLPGHKEVSATTIGRLPEGQLRGRVGRLRRWLRRPR
ncbi:MAG: hypothetical protein ACYDCQ_07520 [Dehalococcoidia bacterium]